MINLPGGFKGQEPSMIDIQMAGEESGAQSFIATRQGYLGEGAVRDAFFIVDGKIKAMMTTDSNKNDPDVRADFNTNIVFAPNTHNADEEQAVKDVVDVYFDGFGALQPEKMQSAFGE